jgi:hypothetical protein
MNKINVVFWLLIPVQLLTSFSYGQEFVLNGKVTDKKSGEPIYYATISVDNDKTIVATDFDGLYSIKVTLNDTILVRYTGMKTQKIKVDTASINIELEEIEELIVVFGPPPIRPIKSTYHSITTVTLEDIQQERKISGKIFNKENNEILAGASIKNKRTGEISQSDVDGNFEISASINDVIEILCVGMSSEKIKVTDKNDYEIYLEIAITRKDKKQKRREKKELKRKGYINFEP